MRSHEFPMPEGWFETMQRVNAEVNACDFKDDPPNDDQWGRMLDGTGQDCDNYAVEKAERLVAAGIPIQRLRLATCYMGADGGRKQGTGHAVLVVDGPHEQYVLSNGLPPMAYPAFVASGWMRDRIQTRGGAPEWDKWVA